MMVLLADPYLALIMLIVPGSKPDISHYPFEDYDALTILWYAYVSYIAWVTQPFYFALSFLLTGGDIEL